MNADHPLCQSSAIDPQASKAHHLNVQEMPGGRIGADVKGKKRVAPAEVHRLCWDRLGLVRQWTDVGGPQQAATSDLDYCRRQAPDQTGRAAA